MVKCNLIWTCFLCTASKESGATSRDNEELVQLRLEESPQPEPEVESQHKHHHGEHRSAQELQLRAAQAFDRFLEGERLDDHGGAAARFQMASGKSSPHDLKNIQWLHVPKAGTSFISTIWGYACGQEAGRLLDLKVNPEYTWGCGECYDRSLLERYPKDTCATGMLHPAFQTSHNPTSLSQIKAGQRVVTIIRDPSQRLISAVRANHLNGFDTATLDKIHAKCPQDQNNPPAECWGRFPGVAGCTTRMLTGGKCADPTGQDPKGRVPQALEALEEMAFVGLTEEWDESICLFHLAFGGDMYSAEFLDIHTGREKAQSYDTDVLNGFVDEADEAVYAAAKKRFQALKLKLAGDKSACEVAKKEVSGSGDSSPAQAGQYSEAIHKARAKVSEIGNKDVSMERKDGPTSCAAENVQCGMHGPLDCGNCPKARLTLPPAVTGSVTCSNEGACLLNGKREDIRFNWDFSAADLKR